MDNAVDTGTSLEDVASGDAASLVGGWMKASWGMLSVEKILWTALLLAVEVFSFAGARGFLLAVAARFLVSGYGGLYSKQKFAFAKNADATGTLHHASDHRPPNAP